MKTTALSLPRKSTRFGFHYFQDNQHYQEKDLKTWLPILQSLEASWLILPSITQRAIPEFFLRPLLENEIEPILQFNLSPSNLPDVDDLESLFDAYANWGIKGVILAERVNSRRSWHSSIWSRGGLVDHFLDSYLPLARRALTSGLIPILPPLEPGGDLWDTIFLRSTLESMMKRGDTELLESFVMSSYAWSFDHPLNWGVGGPALWPDARPYNTSTTIQDQRGFRCHEWYQEVCQTVLGHSVPMILLGVGLIKDPLSKQGDAPDPETQTLVNLAIGRLLAGQPSHEPTDPAIPLKHLPDEVLFGSFWLLSADPSGPQHQHAWFHPEGVNMPIADQWQKWLVDQQAYTPSAASQASPDAGHHGKAPGIQTLSHARPIRNYLLLPSADWVLTDHRLSFLREYIKQFQPAIGFSITEASLAREVTIVGPEDAYPEQSLQELKEAGCLVNRVDMNGMMIAP